MRRRIIFVCLALLAAAAPAAEPRLFIGPRISLGSGFDYGSDYQDTLDANGAYRQFNVRFSLGVFTEIRLSPLLALQPELLFTQSGHKDYIDWTLETRSTRKYLEAVLLAKLIVPAGRNSLQFFAGPDLRYGVGTWEYDINDVTVEAYDRAGRKAADIRNTYLGVTAGAGLRLKRGYNSLQLDTRIYFGLQNVDATDAVRRKPAALWLNLGYGFYLGTRDRSAQPVRFKNVSPRDTLVAGSEDIAANPFFSAYIASGYIQKQLQIHAMIMDKMLGLGQAESFMPFDTEVHIVEPVEILAGLKHPAAGVWRHRFRVTRRGTTRTYNLWFAARKRQEPRYIPGVMGTTRANMEVQYDLVPEVRSAALARVRHAANRSLQPVIVDTRVLENGKSGKDAWREEWTVRAGSETISVLIDFNVGPFGILNYALVQ
jgi:hypothetical protein